MKNRRNSGKGGQFFSRAGSDGAADTEKGLDMTQKYLGQCERLLHQIEEGCESIRRAREVREEVRETLGLFSLFGEDDPMGEMIARNEQRVREMTARANELDGWITSIDDTIVRRAMTLRYLQGLTWPQVAARMGYAGEAGPRMAVSRFIEKLPAE